MEKALMESPGYVCHAMQLVQKARQKCKSSVIPWESGWELLEKVIPCLLERLLLEGMS